MQALCQSDTKGDTARVHFATHFHTNVTNNRFYFSRELKERNHDGA
jgi:hypothetical protein